LFQVHLYRFNQNDPINLPRSDVHDSLTDWLRYFDLDLTRLSSPILDPNQILGLAPPRVELPCYMQLACSHSEDQILGKNFRRFVLISHGKKRCLLDNNIVTDPLFVDKTFGIWLCGPYRSLFIEKELCKQLRM
jgi:hypothetical protein